MSSKNINYSFEINILYSFKIKIQSINSLMYEIKLIFDFDLFFKKYGFITYIIPYSI